MAQKPTLKHAGFTLIELSVVLLILGVLTAGILTVINKKNGAENFDEIKQQLDQIENAIAQYVKLNGHLPCPADMDAAEYSASYGVATDCSAAPPVGTWRSTGPSNRRVRLGAVPTRALSLPDGMMSDPWKGRIGYVVIQDLAIDEAGFDSYSETASDNIISVQKDNTGSNHVTVSNTAGGVIAYALISYGKDRLGAYSRAGTLISSCDNSFTMQYQNCRHTDVGFNNRFLDTEFNDSTINGNYYDDFVRWKTFHHMKAYK